MKGLLVLVALAAPMMAVAESTPDASFYKHAAEAGIAEVDAGTLAADKGSSQAVKDFGSMMAKDHAAVNDKLKTLAQSKSISLPTSASLSQMATKAKLEVLSGATFDKSYIKGQVKAHQDTIVLLKQEIASGQDADAKAFGTATLPAVQVHLKKIKTIAAAAKAG